MKFLPVISFLLLSITMFAQTAEDYWNPVLESSSAHAGRKAIQDSILISSGKTAFLNLSASNDSLFEGECTAITLSFFVREDNKEILQFYDLQNQLDSIIHNQLNLDDAWQFNDNITDIKSRARIIHGYRFDEYKIFAAGYCAIKPGRLTFKPIALRLLTGEDIKLLKPKSFNTRPLSLHVRVLPIPKSLITTGDLFTTTGNFHVLDTVINNSNSSGNTLYEIRVRSTGNAYALQPPEVPGTLLISNIFRDTLLYGTYYASRTFRYVCSDKQIKRAHSVRWLSTYDVRIKSVKSHFISRPIFTEDKSSVPNTDSAITCVNKIVFVLDVSASMMTEDYTPYRAGAVKRAVYNFSTPRQACDISYLMFAGDAVWIPDSLCFDYQAMNDQTYGQRQRGTSISNALITSLQKLSLSSGKKTIVLFSDGEPGNEILPHTNITELARKYNVTIHVIGIGHRGKVPFGRDFSGNTLTVDGTFSDAYLKQLTIGTGGQYRWAKNADDILVLLRQLNL